MIVIAAFAIYGVMIKDQYFAYGSVIAYINKASAKVTYDQDGCLTMTFPDGSTETYMGHLGSSVTKLLLRSGAITQENYLPENQYLAKNEQR